MDTYVKLYKGLKNPLTKAHLEIVKKCTDKNEILPIETAKYFNVDVSENDYENILETLEVKSKIFYNFVNPNGIWGLEIRTKDIPVEVDTIRVFSLG